MDPWFAGLHAGVDEVGIGPLAGPVVAGAVLLDPNRPIHDLQDSKMLTPGKREALADIICEKSLCWALGWASVEEIDELNILKASHLAMQRACSQLSIEPNMVLVDGNKTPGFPMPCVAVVKGDQRIPQVSAASILAKVCRDQAMVELDVEYPGYGFAQHKGYPTKSHVAALQALGAIAEHRRSFAPVSAVLGDAGRTAGETASSTTIRAMRTWQGQTVGHSF